MKHDNPPAFPRPASEDRTDGTLPDGDDVIPAQEGMGLRDYFAAKALAGVIAAHVNADMPPAAELANWAYLTADAMLARRGD